MVPDVGLRNRDVLRKGPWPVDTGLRPYGHTGAPPRQTVAAMAADNVPFAADDLAREEVLDVRPDIDDPAHKLVPDHHRNGIVF